MASRLLLPGVRPGVEAVHLSRESEGRRMAALRRISRAGRAANARMPTATFLTLAMKKLDVAVIEAAAR